MSSHDRVTGAKSRRQEAGVKNRLKWQGFTEDGRRRLREAAQRNRPWERSTGPRSAFGKERASKNGIKHGAYAGTMEHLPVATVKSALVMGQPVDALVMGAAIQELLRLGQLPAAEIASKLTVQNGRVIRAMARTYLDTGGGKG